MLGSYVILQRVPNFLYFVSSFKRFFSIILILSNFRRVSSFIQFSVIIFNIRDIYLILIFRQHHHRHIRALPCQGRNIEEANEALA